MLRFWQGDLAVLAGGVLLPALSDRTNRDLPHGRSLAVKGDVMIHGRYLVPVLCEAGGKSHVQVEEASKTRERQ
jgi:hypothetical protein